MTTHTTARIVAKRAIYDRDDAMGLESLLLHSNRRRVEHKAVYLQNLAYWTFIAAAAGFGLYVALEPWFNQVEALLVK